MAIDADVLVIGGGIAGVFAALSAAERASVRLVSAKQSTLRQASGLIDVLGYVPDALGYGPDRRARNGNGDDGPLPDPFRALDDLPATHPYRIVGEDAVREALLLFDAVVGRAYEGGHTDRNALVVTHGGTVKPTARYPSSVAAGLASQPSDALLVGFASMPDFDAPLAAAHLGAVGVPFRTRGVTVRFPGDLRADARRTRYVRLLDRDETVASHFGETPVRAALAEAVRPHLQGEDRVGFPAILGRENAGVVRRELEERLGARVFEVPTGPPSVPGMRLEDRLYAALEAAGVRVTTGVPVVDYDSADGRIEFVLVDHDGRHVPYHAREYVLATGGLVGTGIQSSRSGVREPIFDCDVPHPDERYEWFADDAFGEHPFARFGVRVDDELRPLDADDEPEFANLRAAGSILEGYDFAAEKSGAGVSIATGYVAGTKAGGAAA